MDEDVRTSPDSGRGTRDLLDPEYAESIGVAIDGTDAVEEDRERADWRWLVLAAGYVVIGAACARQAYKLVREYMEDRKK